MDNPRIYVARVLPDSVMAALQQRYRLTLPDQGMVPSREELLQGLREAEAAICTLTERIDAEALEGAPRLKIVANYAVGFNNIDLDAARRRGVVVTNTPDVLTEATADLTWALLLAVARRIPEGHNLVQRGEWAGWEPLQLLGADIHGKTLGVIGLGRIGQAVARRATGFEMTVRFCSRRSPAQTVPDTWLPGSFEEVVRAADYLTLHVPLTSETHHLLGRRELSWMKSTAYVINTSRGAVIDEAALAEALDQGRIAGAGLDVYEREPALHPGLHHGRIVTLPHLGSATITTRLRMGLVCLHNITAVLEGREPPNRVA